MFFFRKENFARSFFLPETNSTPSQVFFPTSPEETAEKMMAKAA